MRTEHVEVLQVLLGDYNTKKKWSALRRCGVERAELLMETRSHNLKLSDVGMEIELCRTICRQARFGDGVNLYCVHRCE